MLNILHHRFRRLIVCVVGLVMIIVVSACTGVSNTGGTTTATITGTVVSVNAAQHSAVLNVNGQQVTVNGLTDQQVATLQAHVGQTYTLQVTGSGNTVTIAPNSTLEASETQTPEANATQLPATQPPATFTPGSIHFLGTVHSVSNTSIVVSMPTGSTLAMSITTLTDRSHFGGGLPTAGQLIKVDAMANPDGSFTATKLEPTDQGDLVGQNIVEYQGVITSAVGTDRVIHFKVGTKSYAFTIGATADVSDFGGNAQAIPANQLVKVKVQFTGSTGTVLKVERSNG